MKFHLVMPTILALCAILPTIVFATDVSMSDKSFLKKAAQSGNFEVKGSKLALKKSKNTDVQKFAQMMVTDHEKADEELKALAQSKKVELPTDPSFMQKGTLMLLDTYSAKKFDEEYAENVGVDAHEATLALFEKAAKDADDADIKDFASKTLLTLKHHYEMSKKLDKMFD